ncbi:hypothetical protein DFS34DRAFT_605722 [Phlyctochytrium arcticum]|nr:hypothetical protein DFS34DRAFT_605722 [Phlyctochytrium arcticum]
MPTLIKFCRFGFASWAWAVFMAWPATVVRGVVAAGRACWAMRSPRSWRRTLMVSRGWQVRASQHPAKPPASKWMARFFFGFSGAAAAAAAAVVGAATATAATDGGMFVVVVA